MMRHTNDIAVMMPGIEDRWLMMTSTTDIRTKNSSRTATMAVNTRPYADMPESRGYADRHNIRNNVQQHATEASFRRDQTG